MAIEIVDLPLIMVIFRSYVNVYQRVDETTSYPSFEVFALRLIRIFPGSAKVKPKSIGTVELHIF